MAETMIERALSPALIKMIVESVRFAYWGAEQGIMPMDEDVRGPEEFLFDYSVSTGDEDWEGLADRLDQALKGKER